MKYFASFFMAIFLAFSSLASDPNPSEDQLIDEYRPFISHAFEEGLGRSLKDDDKITMGVGGFSKALLFKITSKGEDYIAKVMKGAPEGDVVTEAEGTEIAGSVAAGPQFFYKDVDNKIILRLCVGNLIGESDDIDRHDRGFHKIVAKKLKDLHDTKKSFTRDVRLFDILRDDEKRLADQEFVSTFVNQEDLDLYHHYLQVVEELFKNFEADVRPVHHDLSPLNVLYDGSEAWVIDWETASNDYYPVDLCMFANFHVYDEVMMPDYLTAYFGRQPTSPDWAKFHVIRPFCYIFHGFRLAFLAKQKTKPDLGEVMEYTDFQIGVRRGEVELGSPISLFKLGVSTVNKAMSLIKSKGNGYENLLEILDGFVKASGE